MSAPLPPPPTDDHVAVDHLSFRTVDLDAPELYSYFDTVALVFMDASPATRARTDFRRRHLGTQRLTAAFDRDVVVGTYRSWDTGLTVPGGGRVTADAVSTVTVRPTHRRRGILTRLMLDDLRDAAERGLPVAILIAAEAPIYGRFGFGAATETARWRVDARAARVAPDVARGGTTEIVPETQLRSVAPDVFERARQPGAIDIPPDRWDQALGVERMPDVPFKEGVAAVHRDADGVAQGYARWRPEERWEDRTILTTVQVWELQAATAQAYVALWELLVDIDLVATVDAEERAVDEPLPWLLTDARAARQASRCDFQWSRLLDVPAALSGRSYESAGAVTFEVVDPQGFASGTYTLEADGSGGGSCERSGRDAEVRLPVDVLSALWLGGGDLRAAALAGRAVEARSGGVARLGRLLRTASAPWTPTWF